MSRVNENFNEIRNYLRNDKELTRLLYYPPIDESNEFDPLDISLADIITMSIDKKWQILDKTIKTNPNLVYLEKNKVCCIFVYAGRRIPSSSNYNTARQEVIIDVYCHDSFEKDYRSLRINDRLSEIFVAEKITGLGKMDYVDGGRIGNPPKDYTGYRNVYAFGSVKK